MSKANTIKEIAKKIANNGNSDDYAHIPIGTDSGNVDRPNGETVEDAILKLENNKNIKPLKFTGASTTTYDGSSEQTVNIPNPQIFKGATASAAGSTGLVPAPGAGAQRKYLRDDGTWAVPDTTSYSNMKGATASAAGVSGLVPAPSAGEVTRYLRADATWGSLGAAAFKGVVNNATTTVDGFVPDARVAKDLQDQITALNSALGKMHHITYVYSQDSMKNDLKIWFADFTNKYKKDIVDNGGAIFYTSISGIMEYSGVALPTSDSIRYICVNDAGILVAIMITLSNNNIRHMYSIALNSLL